MVLVSVFTSSSLTILLNVSSSLFFFFFLSEELDDCLDGDVSGEAKEPAEGKKARLDGASSSPSEEYEPLADTRKCDR